MPPDLTSESALLALEKTLKAHGYGWSAHMIDTAAVDHWVGYVWHPKTAGKGDGPATWIGRGGTKREALQAAWRNARG